MSCPVHALLQITYNGENWVVYVAVICTKERSKEGIILLAPLCFYVCLLHVSEHSLYGFFHQQLCTATIQIRWIVNSVNPHSDKILVV